jgi:hypothetical protein
MPCQTIAWTTPLAALEPLVDPMLAMLTNAPEDDEPLSEEDRASLAEGAAAYQWGEAISSNEARRRHGIS